MQGAGIAKSKEGHAGEGNTATEWQNGAAKSKARRSGEGEGCCVQGRRCQMPAYHRRVRTRAGGIRGSVLLWAQLNPNGSRPRGANRLGVLVPNVRAGIAGAVGRF